MKLKLLIFPLILFLSLLAAKPAFAAINCEIASWDPNPRSLNVCLGGFNSIDQINGTIVDFYCLGNSNFPDTIGCRGVTGSVITMSGYTNCIGDINCPIAVEPDGTYTTCLRGDGMSRGIGKMEVRVSQGDNRVCTTNAIYTRPADWDPFTEGLAISGEPGRTGMSAECIKDGVAGVATALGCIPTDFTGSGFITVLLRFIIGIGSGIALLLILYGIFIVTTSAGIPDKLNQGREIISSAIAGLLFIILSIFLLNFIGVKILAIPGL